MTTQLRSVQDAPGHWIVPAAWQDEMAGILESQLRRAHASGIADDIAFVYRSIREELAEGGIRLTQATWLATVLREIEASALTTTGLSL